MPVLYALVENNGDLLVIVEMSGGDETRFPIDHSFIDAAMYDNLFAPPTLEERQAEQDHAS